MNYIPELLENQRTFFIHGNTLEFEYRKESLLKLKSMLKENETEIYYALKQDLNKSKHEAFVTELGFLYSEIDFTLKNLKAWMAPEKVPSPLSHKGSKSYIMKEPYGVVLVISPWNYPLHLALAPAIAALAAGNCVMIKPSEHAKATSQLLSTLIQDTFDPSLIVVVEDGVETTQTLLGERFDYIFFTGSTSVGKIVMKAASEHLTPITLELGGKSPAIIDSDANVNLAAKRITWAKFTNAGQTCVAPDYLYVHDDVKFKFMKALVKQIKSLFGKHPLYNENYTKIINEKHFNRLINFIDQEKVIHGGGYEPDTRLIEPTVLDKVTWDDPIMQEEIFGPLLPILTFRNIEDALYKIKRKEKPLALYYFGENEKIQQQVIEFISFGGGAINDAVYHLGNPFLPFGGVGQSGMGAYHGQYGFDTFTHQKGILKQTTKFDFPFRYQGSKLNTSVVKRIMK
ncbi:aldehyde dehydrogenase [Oceanobacillus alkalisoli]|uniref:aldehyde dehydrogenase n=1 Tax=Oceanobacillus alkalisoli TaxID=2925113 RepID=UPI001F11FBFF|nr:aldehyde dehydrogenase [Oceanobacillus alkalisoli]MCF3941705.1 aldehyde dehydrogenase [Oceanobacillus alkalisoli]